MSQDVLMTTFEFVIIQSHLTTSLEFEQETTAVKPFSQYLGLGTSNSLCSLASLWSAASSMRHDFSADRCNARQLTSLLTSEEKKMRNPSLYIDDLGKIYEYMNNI